jgi:hypothetical protein
MKKNVKNGESTLQGGQKCYHITLVSKGVNVWISTMVILKHILPIFLHNMVEHNIENSIEKISFFQLILCDSKIYLWQKIVHHNVLKNANIFILNDWNDL